VYENVNVLIGKTLTHIEYNEDEMIFTTSNGEIYKMYHEQNCCESVSIEDITGDLSDLLHATLTMAEEVTNNDNPKTIYDESYTWTFYKFATIKGFVTIRWYGESNGYYSESVDFRRVN
jgi:hypothetical protein